MRLRTPESKPPIGQPRSGCGQPQRQGGGASEVVLRDVRAPVRTIRVVPNRSALTGTPSHHPLHHPFVRYPSAIPPLGSATRNSV
jgi:hypothetical protein